jgi:hypothetical protein
MLYKGQQSMCSEAPLICGVLVVLLIKNHIEIGTHGTSSPEKSGRGMPICS